MLLLRSRWEATTFDLISARRDDLLRRSDSGHWSIGRRIIYCDQSVLGTPNLAMLI